MSKDNKDVVCITFKKVTKAQRLRRKQQLFCPFAEGAISTHLFLYVESRDECTADSCLSFASEKAREAFLSAAIDPMWIRAEAGADPRDIDLLKRIVPSLEPFPYHVLMIFTD